MFWKHQKEFRPRPKSANLDLNGQTPFISEQNKKTVNSETQYLEKLCPTIAFEKVKGNRASNDYAAMVFKEPAKDSFKGTNEHY